ncbi:hypothetical protein Pfo_016553 [Paulownia fortunei]|nr:hypothetical protein Pfo_016553 [Paulownia fortunei]
MQVGNGMDSESEAMEQSFSHYYATSTPLWFDFWDMDDYQNTSYHLNASSQVRAMDVPLKWDSFQEQSAMDIGSAPSIHGVMESQHYQPINSGYGLNLNVPLQAMNGSKNNLISPEQSVISPSYVPSMTGGTQLQSMARQNPSFWSENVMQPQPAQNMNIDCDITGEQQRLNEPLNDNVSQQRFTVAPSSSLMDPAGTQLRPMACQDPTFQSEDDHVGVFQPAHPVVENNCETTSMPNMSAFGANSKQNTVMQPQSAQNMNIGCDIIGEIQRSNLPLNNIDSQQPFAVAPSSPRNPAVGASQCQNMENNHETKSTTNLLASLASKATEAGSEPQCDQHKDVSVHLRLNDNPTPSGGTSFGASQRQNLDDNHETQSTTNFFASLASKAKEPGSEVPQIDQHKDVDIQLQLKYNSTPSDDMVLLTVPQFVVQIPTSLPFNCWKGEIIKKLEAELDNIRTIVLPIAGKVAMQTEYLSDIKQNILKRKRVQGATEDYFSDYTKTNVVPKPHIMKNISPPGVKNSTNALSSEIPIVRNQAARTVIQQNTCNTLSPQMEAHDVDKKQKISEPSQRQQRRFSLDEIEALINAVGNFGTGAWQEIKQKAFHASGRTYTELKDKWRSLVKTANKPAGKRRGPVVPQDLLSKVLYFEARRAQLQGKASLV